jgi:hypothetical protein
MTVYIELTSAGADTGPFNLYSNVDLYTSAFEVGVSRLDLTNGYTSNVVPNETTSIRIKSSGNCINYIDIKVDTSNNPFACDTLGGASSFGILAGTTITNTGSTTIAGNLGLYPGNSVVGFPPGTITGEYYVNSTIASNSLNDANNAFTCLNSLSTTGSVGANIGGTAITPGIYSVSDTLTITGIVTLDGLGDPNAVFIFQIPSTFNPAAGAIVELIDDARPGNVYWLVGSSATLGAGSVIVGNIIASDSITINSGVTLTGRAFALTGSMILDTSNITSAVCTINPCSIL